MKVCVTGGAGFIGGYTIKALRERGYLVLSVDRHKQKFRERVMVFRADITNLYLLRTIFDMERPDAVIHLAANSSLTKSIDDISYDAKQNIVGTINVILASQDVGVERIVFASTSAVYAPKLPGHGVYHENDLIAPQVPYGISKAAGEMYVRYSKIPYAILRYGNVYGPKQKPLGENILIARALAHMIDGKPFQINGDGEQTRDWVYIDDVVDANLLALSSPMVGTFNVATGRGTSVNKIVSELRELTNYNGRIPHGPDPKGELRDVILKSHRAEQTLGWRAETELIHGLAATKRMWMS